MSNIRRIAGRLLPRSQGLIRPRAAHSATRAYSNGTGRAGHGSGPEHSSLPGTGGKGASGSQIAAAVGAGALVIVAAFYKWTADTPAPGPPGSTPLKADSVPGNPLRPDHVSGNEIDNTPGVERYTGSKLKQREAQGKRSWTSTDMAKEKNRPHSEEWHQHHDGDESTPNMVVKSAAAIPNHKKTAKRVDGRTE